MSQHPSFDQLSPILGRLGLPPLVGIRRLDSGGAVERHLLSFEGAQADLVLSRELWNTGFEPLEHEAAAVTVLMMERVPCAQGLQILPAGTLDLPASIASIPPATGAPSVGVVLRTLGEVVNALTEVFLPTHGTRAESGTFVPRRDGWRAEWLAYTEAQLAGLRGLGMAELLVVQQLHRRVHEGIDSLPDAPMSSLVHFGLRPGELAFDSAGRWVGLGGLQHSLAGHGLATWAPLIGSLSGEHLAATMRGAGVSESSLDTAALGVYAATHALVALRDSGQRMRHRPGWRSTRGLERALELAAAASEPGYISARLQRAAAGIPAEAGRSERRGSVSIRALWALGTSPPPPSNRAVYLLSALGCEQLGDGGEAPVVSHFRKVGHLFLDGLDLPRSPALGSGPAAGWREELVGTLRRAGGGGPGVAIGLAAAVFAALDAWADSVPAPCVEGLRTQLHGLIHHERVRRAGGSLDPVQRVLHGLIGHDAALELGLDELAMVWSRQVVESVDVIESGGQGTASKEAFEALLPEFVGDFAYPDSGRLVPAALAATRRLSEAGVLPVRPAQALRVCRSQIRAL